MSEKEALIESIREFITLIKGLSMEIEGLRVNTSSTTDFVQITLRDVLMKLNSALEQANRELHDP